MSDRLTALERQQVMMSVARQTCAEEGVRWSGEHNARFVLAADRGDALRRRWDLRRVEMGDLPYGFAWDEDSGITRSWYLVTSMHEHSHWRASIAR